MKVLLTGCNSFIGKELMKCFDDNQINFIGIDLNHNIIERNKEYYSKENLFFLEGHISEKFNDILKIAKEEGHHEICKMYQC